MTNTLLSGSQGLSWLELQSITPEPAVQEIFVRTKERFGHIRNAQRIVAHRSALALAQDRLSRAVQNAPDSGITPFERELIALVVSVENRCEPCVFAHAAILREISQDPALVGKIEVNYRHVDLTERQRFSCELRRQGKPFSIIDRGIGYRETQGRGSGRVRNSRCSGDHRLLQLQQQAEQRTRHQAE